MSETKSIQEDVKITFSRNVNEELLKEAKEDEVIGPNVDSNYQAIVLNGATKIGLICVQEKLPFIKISSIFILEAYRQKGYGFKAIQKVVEMNSNMKIYAFVSPDNESSMKMFTRASFVQESQKIMENELVNIMVYEK